MENGNQQKKRIVVFDLEIKAEIDGKVVGWKSYDKMGISVGVAWDSLNDEYKIFMDDNIQELGKLLEEADIISGFNIEGFDLPLLEATLGRKLKIKACYDVLKFSRYSVGWKEGGKFPTGLKLDDHLEATYGKEFMKTAHGAEAPKMWQAGRLGTLVSYCVADVRREKELFLKILKREAIASNGRAERIFMCPQQLLETSHPSLIWPCTL